jgi:membrane-associated phospholipid phosphatase
MMSDFIEADKWLFRHINGKWHHPWLDIFLPLFRSAEFWYPFYIFLLVLVVVNFKQGKWQWILFFGLVPGITDFISSGLIKENFFRLRPCNDPAMADKLRYLLGYKPQSSSFTSSHAANHFAMGSFLFFTLKERLGKPAFLFFLWAAIICWAQVYVGVHYPLDVISGAFVGFCIGSLFSYFFNKKIQLNY